MPIRYKPARDNRFYLPLERFIDGQEWVADLEECCINRTNMTRLIKEKAREHGLYVEFRIRGKYLTWKAYKDGRCGRVRPTRKHR